jgi:hypothetical protein
MTLSLKIAIRLAREFASKGGGVDERVDAVRLTGHFADSEEQREWIDLRKNANKTSDHISIYDLSISDELQDEDVFDAGRLVIITIVKPIINGCIVIIFSENLAVFLNSLKDSRKILVADMKPECGFRAIGLDVVPWQPGDLVLPFQSPVAINPRLYVRDQVEKREIVDDLTPWIIVDPPQEESIEFMMWKHVSARRLLGSLSNSAYLHSGDVWLEFKGPPAFRIAANDNSVNVAWDELSKCARWVYCGGSDIDVRHLIFAAELGRVHRSGTLRENVEIALEAAHATYEAHVQSSSRETIKALADLRKAIIDETHKITQRAQELTNSLWRDVAIASAPFLVSMLGRSNGSDGNYILGSLFIISAAILATTFFLQVRINESYFSAQHNSRQQWMHSLRSLISDQERLRIAEDPIHAAIKNYKDTRLFVGIACSGLIAILIGVGLNTLGIHWYAVPRG